MSTRKLTQYQVKTPSSTPQIQTKFQSRSFGEQTEETPAHGGSASSLGTHADIAHQGHNFGQIPLLQPKLTVGAPNDHYEQEADRVADQVMTMPAPGSQPGIQRQAEEEELQTKPLASTITPLVQRAAVEEEELQTKPSIQRVEEEELQTKPLIQRAEEEEELQTKPLIQRAAEEEEQLQTKPSIQRAEEEEELQTKSLIQRAEEEEELQTKPLIQRAAEEEEELQTKPSIQRAAEEEELQTKPLIQRAAEEEEELQTKPSIQRAAEEEELQTKPLIQRAAEEEELQTKPSIQRAAEEEELQTKPSIQRAGEEEELQTKPLIQRAAEEEELQTKPLIQRAAAQEEDELQTKPSIQREAEDEALQMKQVQRKGGDRGFSASSNVESQLNSTKGSGSPLPAEVRAFMEPRFGVDLSHVRVHTGDTAVQMNREVGALAFTHRQDVYFGAGQSPGNDALTAHELTHVIQQTGAQPLSAESSASSHQTVVQQKCTQCAEENLQRQIQPALQVSSIASLIQRYAVPGSLACADVVDWLNTNSPYSPEWAQTQCTYSFNGNLRTRSHQTPGGDFEVTVTGHSGLSVSKSCPIDSPQWAPSPRPNRAAEVAAWGNMKSVLDAHEQQHRTIGEQQRVIAQNNFRAVNFTVTGSTQQEAQNNAVAQVRADQQQWQADAQTAQDAIDPFRGAVLACP